MRHARATASATAADRLTGRCRTAPPPPRRDDPGRHDGVPASAALRREVAAKAAEAWLRDPAAPGALRGAEWALGGRPARRESGQASGTVLGPIGRLGHACALWRVLGLLCTLTGLTVWLLLAWDHVRRLVG